MFDICDGSNRLRESKRPIILCWPTLFGLLIHTFHLYARIHCKFKSNLHWDVNELNQAQLLDHDLSSMDLAGLGDDFTSKYVI